MSSIIGKVRNIFLPTIVEPEEKTVALGLTHETGSFLIFGNPGNAVTPTSALSLYKKSTAVSIPVNLVADAFASIIPVISIDGKLFHKHEILELLAMPSPFYTKSLFLETLGKDYLVTGETYMVALGSVNRPPIEIQPISPRNTSVIQGVGGVAVNLIVSGETLAGDYKVVDAKRRVRYFDGNLRELKQIRNYSPDDNSLLRGFSPLRSASAEVMQHIQGNRHNVSLLENGGRVSLVFHFDADMGNDDFQAAKASVIAQYGGPGKAGQIGVTGGTGNAKLDIKELGTNNKDMDFANLQMMSKIAVALQYKVPLPLITLEATTFNNFTEAKLALYDDAVLPLADRIFGGLSQLLVPRFGLDPKKVRITYDPDQITALEKRRNENLKLRKELNLESINEMREAIGKNAVTGGEVVRVQANMIPIDSDIFSDPEEPDPGNELARDNDGE